MSTASENIAEHFTDAAAAVYPSKRKKVQTPYKPRLSTLVKRALEDSVNDAIEAQRLMEMMLTWLQHETDAYDALLERMAALPVPLDYRMVELLKEEQERRMRIGDLQGILARMALTVTSLERRLQRSLETARQGVEPAKRKAREEDEQERTPSGDRRQ